MPRLRTEYHLIRIPLPARPFVFLPLFFTFRTLCIDYLLFDKCTGILWNKYCWYACVFVGPSRVSVLVKTFSFWRRSLPVFKSQWNSSSGSPINSCCAFCVCGKNDIMPTLHRRKKSVIIWCSDDILKLITHGAFLFSRQKRHFLPSKGLVTDTEGLHLHEAIIDIINFDDYYKKYFKLVS